MKLNHITITEEDYETLTCGGDTERFKIVEESDWVVEHKYEYREIIFEDKETSKFYRIVESRYDAGSYYTDYLYDDPVLECTEVEPVEVTTIQYRDVKYI